MSKLWEAWFKCGCTKIAPRRDIVEYCAIHGEDREHLTPYIPMEEDDLEVEAEK